MSKVTYGLKNLYFAKVAVGANGVVAYGVPKPIPGASEMSLAPKGEDTPVYADDTTLVSLTINQGYDGDITVYGIPDDFTSDILGMTQDANGVFIESADDVKNQFALMGEFSSESTTKKRWTMYNCKAGRTDFASKSKADKTEAQAFKIPIVATPAEDSGHVKATVTNDRSNEIFASWLSSVYVSSGKMEQKVTVTVTKTTTPMPGAIVVCGNKMAVTDALGNAVFMQPAGKYDIMVSATGCTAKVDNVVVASVAISKAIALTASV